MLDGKQSNNGDAVEQAHQPDGPARHGACKQRKRRAGPNRWLCAAFCGQALGMAHVMTLVTLTLVFVFLLCCCAGVISWCIGVFETIAVFQLEPWVYRLGPVATRYDETMSRPLRLDAPCTGETLNFKYRVLDGSICLFRRKFAPFSVRVRTVLELKGSLLWSEGTLLSVGRYPLGMLLFASTWLLGCVTFTLLSMIQRFPMGLAVGV